AHHELVLFARSLHQDVELRPDLGVVLRAGDASLKGHQAAIAVCGDERLNLRLERVARARLFVRVAEDADVFERGPLDEIAKLAELRIGLAWMADDERRAKAQVRNACAQSL